MTINQVNKQRKVAIVTGAGSGVGKAVALALLADGYCVALAGRRVQPLQDVAHESGANTSGEIERALVIPCDVADAASVQSLFATAVAKWGRVDVLFNNAGVGNPPGLFEDWTVEQWKGVVDINLTGMFLCIQQAFKTMKAQTPRGGRIINNGSIAATTPRPNTMAYTATKHAVLGLTKSANLDGRKYDIAVGQIDIGNAATDMTVKMAAGIMQANGSVMQEPVMDVAIVGQSVVYMANLPLNANVLYHTVMATNMPFVGRG